MRDLREYANQCLKELDAIGIRYGNPIEFKVNKRFTRKYGLCQAYPDRYVINIAVFLLDERNDEKALKETVIHEILHTCGGCMNHGEGWLRLAETVNRAYGYNIKEVSTTEEEGVDRETVPTKKPVELVWLKCGKCGYACQKGKTTDAARRPEKYRCKCGGDLSIVSEECVDDKYVFRSRFRLRCYTCEIYKK